MVYIATRNTGDLRADNEVIEEVGRELSTEAAVSAEEAWAQMWAYGFWSVSME